MPIGRSIGTVSAILVVVVLLWAISSVIGQEPKVEVGSVGIDARGDSPEDPRNDRDTDTFISRSGERTTSVLRWAVRASGLIGLVILGMSIYLLAVVIWMFYHFRRASALPGALIEDVIGLLARKHYDRAYARLAGDRSFLGRTLTPAIRKLPHGQAAAQRALEMANEEVTMEWDHRTTYLATIGTLGPMIGLVGTVYGMIRSFQAIATQGATPDAARLAAGISTALFVTLEGIALAVPAIAFYAFFRNRIARLSLEVQMTAEALLDQFAPGVRSPHPLATPVVTNPAGSSPVTVPSRSALPHQGEV